MLLALVVPLRSLALICRGHQAIALENLALRQQLAVCKRTVRCPQLRHRDRLSWMLLAKPKLASESKRERRLWWRSAFAALPLRRDSLRVACQAEARV